MRPSEIQQYFFEQVPNEYPEHMFCFFAKCASSGVVHPFVFGLVGALSRINDATPGYAKAMIDRIAAIGKTGETQYESLTQILSEIYVTEGAVAAADRDENGREMLNHEPSVNGGKNPEFESCSNGIWYAVEVKTPALIEHSRRRSTEPFQLTARLPRDVTDDLEKTLPRDNPVKDFLTSANEKLEEYAKIRPDAIRILTVVWDDFCNEPISSLLSPASGLLTENSFHCDASGKAMTYPFIDGVVVCRYQHQIIRTTRLEPLIDGEVLPFVYRHHGFPPKVFISNPGGREIPDRLMDSLNAVPHSVDLGAEYIPSELVLWIGDRSDGESE